MFMINEKIDIDSNVVHRLDVDFFESVYQSGLVDMLLEWMQTHLEGLVLTHNWTPKIQDLIHWILLISCKTDCFLQNEGMVFKKFLTIMA